MYYYRLQIKWDYTKNNDIDVVPYTIIGFKGIIKKFVRALYETDKHVLYYFITTTLYPRSILTKLA
jgi:hypothetical protein